LAATITAHHLLMNRNSLFTGGIRPHHYCLPVLKREEHRIALVEMATSGNPRFFLGTDSAPHPKGEKESSCGCAGCYTAHNALGLYAEAFDSVGKLDRLEGFASHYGADYYNLPRHTETITLVNQPQTVPFEYPMGKSTLVPLRAGETIGWSIAS
jgi:dihydroorotase